MSVLSLLFYFAYYNIEKDALQGIQSHDKSVTIGTSLRDMPMGFGGECGIWHSFPAPVLHPQKHAGTYRRALFSEALGQAGIEKPGADCLQWPGGEEIKKEDGTESVLRTRF